MTQSLQMYLNWLAYFSMGYFYYKQPRADLWTKPVYANSLPKTNNRGNAWRRNIIILNFDFQNDIYIFLGHFF